ncbi:hypothetical protein IO457_001756 [Campylobacter coli]|nr:hypothetical protein [Campylobacter coli]
MDRKRIKQSIKEWILEINRQEALPKGIVALNFGLFEPYGIELIGAENYDENDDDWACEEDFVPKLRICPALEIPSDLEWESVLELMIDILKELVMELKHIKLLQVPHISTGFCDGDLEIIK